MDLVCREQPEVLQPGTVPGKRHSDQIAAALARTTTQGLKHSDSALDACHHIVEQIRRRVARAVGSAFVGAETGDGLPMLLEPVKRFVQFCYYNSNLKRLRQLLVW